MILLLVLLLALSINTAKGQELDYRYRRQVNYVLDQSDSVWTATSTEVVSQVFLTQRSLRETDFWEYASYFNPIESVKARINGRRVDDEYIETVTPEYSDAFLNDHKAVHISMPRALSVGDSLSYVIERTWSDATYFPVHRIPNFNQTAGYSIDIKHPESLRVDFTVIAARSDVAGLVNRSIPGRTSITFSELPYLPSLLAYPFDGAHAFVAIEISEGGGLVTKNHPRDFGKWYTSLFSQTCDLSTSDRERILQSLQGSRTGRDTIRGIYDHVRRSVRYVADERGANSYVPRMPSVVMRQGYGDCKDRAHFVSSFLRSLGYDAGMVLINTEPRPEFKNTVHMSLFNHVIGYAVLNGDTLFFDPTSQFTSFGNLPEMDVDRRVFLIHARPPHWTHTPPPSRLPTLTISANIDPRDPLNVPAQIILRNDMASRVNYSVGVVHPKDVSTMLTSMIADELTKIRVTDPTIESVTDSLVIVKANLDMRTFLVKGSEQSYCPLVPIRHLDASVLDRSKDTLPLFLGDRADVVLQLRFSSPTTIRDTSVTINGPAGSVFSVVTSRDESGQPIVRYRWKIGVKRYEGEMRKAFLQFLQAVIKARRSFVTIK
ncbi:MAG: transglutaminase domain-containing protein [Candidatus Kapabacteria bacterium]|nr:transglutaminase domain-containing protein [Candidatus Kapabacteria bacterium]